MKTKFPVFSSVPVFKPVYVLLYAVLLYILPYITSCNKSAHDVSLNPVEPVYSALPVSCLNGNLKLNVRYTNGTTRGVFCYLAQTAGITQIAYSIRPGIILTLPLEGAESVTITNWRGERFWGRAYIIGGDVDSMCCRSVRLESGTWFMENETDTIRYPHEFMTVINAYEKCGN